MKNSTEVPQETKNRTTLGSSTPGVYLEETRTLIWKDTPMFVVALFTIAQM